MSTLKAGLLVPTSSLPVVLCSSSFGVGAGRSVLLAALFLSAAVLPHGNEPDGFLRPHTADGARRVHAAQHHTAPTQQELGGLDIPVVVVGPPGADGSAVFRAGAVGHGERQPVFFHDLPGLFFGVGAD